MRKDPFVSFGLYYAYTGLFLIFKSFCYEDEKFADLILIERKAFEMTCEKEERSNDAMRARNANEEIKEVDTQ